jgi:4-oxalocrotonate tautomerase
MPYIDVRIYEGRLTEASEKELVARLTDAVAEVFGDEIRQATWITLTGVPERRWGIAGVTG